MYLYMYKPTHTGIPCGNSDNNAAIVGLSAVLGLMVLIIIGLCFGIGLVAVKGRTHHKGKLHIEQTHVYSTIQSTPEAVLCHVQFQKGSRIMFEILEVFAM